MFETPDADPTCSAGTHAVDADDDGPLLNPIPTATAMSGRTNALYSQDDSTRPTAAKPTAVTRKPMPITWRPPSLLARRGTSGATATSPAVAGSVASPACRGEKPRVEGSW